MGNLTLTPSLSSGLIASVPASLLNPQLFSDYWTLSSTRKQHSSLFWPQQPPQKPCVGAVFFRVGNLANKSFKCPLISENWTNNSFFSFGIRMSHVLFDTHTKKLFIAQSEN